MKHTPLQTAMHVLGSRIPAGLQREFKLQLRNLPPRYFQSLDLPGVRADLTLIERLHTERVTVSTTEDNGRLTLRVLMAHDEPGIFLRVAGILARRGISIERASIFTGEDDGMVLDHFVLHEPVDRAELETVMDDLRCALWTGKYDRPRLDPPDTHGLKISVENLRNSDHTTVTLTARDQLGFLYRVAEAFSWLDVSLRYAKIRTLNGKIIDTFHVLTHKGAILNDEQQRELCEVLAKVFRTS